MKNAPTFVERTSNSLTEELEVFILDKKTDGLAERSLDNYRWHIKKFIQVMNDLKIKDINSITARDYKTYVRTLQDEGMKDVTVTSNCRSVRVFLYWAMNEEHLEEFKIKLPKYQKTTKVTYTDDDLMKLLKKPNVRDCSFSEYKIWVFENVVISTGLRLSSLINLKIGDIDFTDNCLIVNTTKNKKPLRSYFNPIIGDILKEYLKYRGGKDDDFLFCTDKGNQISKRGIEQDVQRYNLKRGVSKSGIHLFRHTFAKNAVLAGMDVFTLMRILQHSDVQTTLNYVQILNVDAKKSCETYNPQRQFNVNNTKIRMNH